MEAKGVSARRKETTKTHAFMLPLNSRFHALGQWGRSKNRAGDVRDLSLTSHFFVPEPARRPPAFVIVTPALSLHMETGYS